MVGYIISLVLFVLIFVSYPLCCLFKTKFVAFLNKHSKIVNLVFVCISFICYLIVVIVAYIQNGLHDWNFINTLPTANVSPFMFATLPLYFILRKKAKEYYLNIIALLSVGMILSPVISMIFNIQRNYSFHAFFLADYVAHLFLSLWGIYIVSSKQIELELKKSLICVGIMASVAFTMLVLNLIFDTSFFGLSLRGKHNIYNVVITKSSFLSCLIYFVGLVGIMIGGHFFQTLFKNND